MKNDANIRRRYWRDTPIAQRIRDKEQAEEAVFFHRRDRELLQRMATATEEERRDYVRALTRMRCPECGRPLAAVSHLGVRVEECPAHHGMWLTEQERRTIARRERHSWISRYLYGLHSADAEREPPLT